MNIQDVAIDDVFACQMYAELAQEGRFALSNKNLLLIDPDDPTNTISVRINDKIAENVLMMLKLHHLSAPSGALQ